MNTKRNQATIGSSNEYRIHQACLFLKVSQRKIWYYIKCCGLPHYYDGSDIHFEKWELQLWMSSDFRSTKYAAF